MRKIESQHSRGKKQKRNQIILGGVLIIVMLGSIFGIIINSFGNEEDEKVEYNGLEFVNQNNMWKLNIEDIQFLFKYNPYQVEEIDCDIKDISNYYGKPLYLSSKNEGANLEIYNNLGRFALRMQNACTEEEECEGNYPIKTCEDNFIIVQESDEISIIQEENCVFIKGPQEKIIQITDEFLFKLWEIK